MSNLIWCPGLDSNQHAYAPPPQDGVSTNFTTWAMGKTVAKLRDLSKALKNIPRPGLRFLFSSFWGPARLTLMAKLFAVYLGGRAPKCNTELHDVVFAVGDSLKDCKNQLCEQWFGSQEQLHVDSWIEMTHVDGHKLSLTKHSATHSPLKLYFVNLGAYKPGQFTEFHENRFYVCTSKEEAKARAKSELCVEGFNQVHTDDLFEVDDLLEISEISGYKLELSPDPSPASQPNNAWLPMTKI